MKVFLFLLFVLALVGLYAYLRLRPYIRAARQIFGAARDARRVNERRDEPADLPRRPATRTGEKLVRCASCGTWHPSANSILVGGTHFCSHQCLERSADDTRRTQRSAS